MFEGAICNAAKEMREVKRVEYVDATCACISFSSNSGKSTYPYEFTLSDDGTLEIQPMASGPYLSANAPRRFSEIARSYL